jgi:hypothetical protein
MAMRTFKARKARCLLYSGFIIPSAFGILISSFSLYDAGAVTNG